MSVENLMTFNRTIIELKLKNPFEEPGADRTFNRTIIELKQLRMNDGERMRDF